MNSVERAGLRIGQLRDGDEVGRMAVHNKKVYEEKLNTGNRNDDQPFHPVYSIHDIATVTTVVDHLGQKLNLYIENKLGGGGQRHITIYCPYWIVNTTEHALRYRQENTSSYVSGTVLSPSQDGSRPVDLQESTSDENLNLHTIFPGKVGALSRNNLSVSEFSSLMEKEIPLHQIASMAFMFNFRDFLSIGGYERKLTIQLADPTGGSKYCSEWSHGFSLESVGVSQTITMHCMDGRQLEIAMTTRVASGKLSHYTKIVRFSPKYVLVNQLERPIRLWQDSSLMHPSRTLDGFKSSTSNREPSNWRERSKEKHTDESIRKYDFLFGDVAQLDYRRGTKMRPGTVADRSALYITTAGKGEMIPFHLPDTKSDRELRIDIGRKWNLTASFHSDIICDHTFKVTPVVDLRILKHVDNRASARYTVELPPPQEESEQILGAWDGELGLWFETIQWSHGTKIVVKGTKRGKYSINNTDIHVGDELVQIDDTLVSHLTFVDTMKLLKERLSEVLDAYRSNQLQSIQNPVLKPKKPKFLKRFDKSNQSNQPAIQENPDTIPSKDRETITLVFQTLEHRMKKLRGKALGRRNVSTRMRGNAPVNARGRIDSGHHKELARANENISLNRGATSRHHAGNTLNVQNKEDRIQVSMKHLNQSIFVFVHGMNFNSPYRIENRSLDHVIYFRQRGCNHHQWNSLPSGDSVDYTWEEPMKPHKLTVRVGIQRPKKPHVVKKFMPFNLIENEDQAGFGASRTVRLDEIGFTDSLPCPGKIDLDANGSDSDKNKNSDTGYSFLHCHISAEGKTKKLVISEHENSTISAELKQLESHLANLTRQIAMEREKNEALLALKCLPSHKTQSIAENESVLKSNMNAKKNGLPTVKENEITIDSLDGDGLNGNEKAIFLNNIERAIVEKADYPDGEFITSRHQVLVEVVEASGLRHQTSGDTSSPCSPYCTIRVIRRSTKHRPNIFSSKSDSSSPRRTYFIDKSDAPKWSGMKFIFDVSPEAESDPQGYAILVKVKDFHLIGKNGSLGMTEIRLRNLKHQKEIFGWYPLMARTGRGSEILAAGAGKRGSVKIRVQWIYSISALLNYYIILSENRLKELSANCEGMKGQLENLKKAEEVEQEMAEVLSKSLISFKASTTTKLLQKSAVRSNLHNKSTRSILKWSRQKGPVHNLAAKFDEASLSPLYEPEIIGDIDLKERSSRDGEESSCGSMEINEVPLPFCHSKSYSDGGQYIEDMWSSYLPTSITSMKSWLQASELLNHSRIKQFYVRDIAKVNHTAPHPTKLKSHLKKDTSFDSLVLPPYAPLIMQQRKHEFLEILHSSRGKLYHFLSC
jgi:hypothetical protein